MLASNKRNELLIHATARKTSKPCSMEDANHKDYRSYDSIYMKHPETKSRSGLFRASDERRT